MSKVCWFFFYLGWSGSILQFRQNVIKVGSKSWLLTCSSNITLSLPSYTGSALKKELNFCNGSLSLLYFWLVRSLFQPLFFVLVETVYRIGLNCWLHTCECLESIWEGWSVWHIFPNQNVDIFIVFGKVCTAIDM